MENIAQEINAIYQAVSTIPVTGDAVDTMAVARAKLRKVYTELKTMSEEVSDDGHGA